jgi:hypothetical protein
MDQVKAGTPIAAIARAASVSERFVRARLPLALLAPDIIAAIADGRQPRELTTETLIRSSIPVDWRAQRQLFGFTQALAAA